MPSSFTIREATVTDLAATAALENAVFDHNAYPAFFFRQAYDVFGDFFLVAEDEQAGVIGYTIGGKSSSGAVGWVLSIAVNPSHRRKGVARALMEALAERLDDAGASSIRLTVEPDNGPAIAAYLRLGFTAVETDPDYFGPGDVRTVMEKRIR